MNSQFLGYPSGLPPTSMRQDEYMTYTLVLLRHGESEWNAKNLFTGWVDVHLSEKGIEEAKRGGNLMAEAEIHPDIVHTSLLRRAITTANLEIGRASCRERVKIGAHAVSRKNKRSDRYAGTSARTAAEMDRRL